MKNARLGPINQEKPAVTVPDTEAIDALLRRVEEVVIAIQYVWVDHDAAKNQFGKGLSISS